MASKQFCSIRDWLTNSCEWTLSRSPLKVVSYQWNLDRVFLNNSRVLSKILGMPPYLSLMAWEKETENELTTSIIFCVTISLLLMLLVLSSYVFMTSTKQLLQYHILVMQASFPDIYTYRLWLIFWYTLVAFEDCDFFNEVFSLEFF